MCFFTACVKEKRNVYFTCSKLMLDKKQSNNNHFFWGGDIYLYVYLPIIRTTDNSKLNL